MPPLIRRRDRQEDRDKRQGVAMKRDTGKPSGGCRSAPGGPTPAGRTRRARRAERRRKQGPARRRAPQSARPDQIPAQRPGTETAKQERNAPLPDTRPAGRAPPRPTPPAETLSHKGALALAKQLEKYWHDRGYPAARFWAEPIGERFEKIGTYELYRVKSNLVNGLPPRYLDGG
ncbi:MAG: hypothetical protein QOJ96_724 [Alphaproteobacteria bacterium]|nr:hypothetical protein [Alphaproteobacteria bacterium]